MNTIAIYLMQARTEAFLIIILLLLVSVIIGYVTAWLYFRFIHKRKVEALEATIKKHENQIDKLKNTKNEQKISEQDEALLQMAKRKHLLNYSSFGTATIEEKLNVLGIFTLRQIANFNDEDVEIVTEAIEFFPGRIERDEWVSQAKELLKNKGKRDVILDRVKEKKSNVPFNRIGIAPKHFANNLTLIKGISPWVEEKLNKLDIFTFAQISKLTAEDVNTITEILEIAPKRIERDNWIGQAKEFAKAKATSPQH